MSDEPIDTLRNEHFQFLELIVGQVVFRVFEPAKAVTKNGKCTDGGCRREGGTGKPTDPVSVRRFMFEQNLANFFVGGANSVRIGRGSGHGWAFVFIFSNRVAKKRENASRFKT